MSEQALIETGGCQLFHKNYQKTPDSVDLPDSFNWRNVDGKDYTTPVKNQGTVPSCWAFAAIGALESMIEIREDCPELNPDLSEQYLVSCLELIRVEHNVRPFYWIMDSSPEGNDCNGVVTESCFPYEFTYEVPCSHKCSDWQDHLISISNFSYWIPDKSPAETDDIIKRKIMENGPVTAFMEGTLLWDRWGNICHNSRAYYPHIPSVGMLTGNWMGLHLIVLVGWQDNPLMPSGGYWICKNSWGTDWGYGGYFNAAYGALGIGRVIYPVDDIYVPYIGTVEYDPATYDWPPIAKPGGPYTGIVGEYIPFDASDSIDAEKNIISYEWDFGDGTHTTGMTCSHQYTTTGEYEVSLVVTDAGNNTDSATTSVFIDNGHV